MYDMYPWDSASQGDYPPQPLRSVRNAARRAPKPRDLTAAQAVQVALDRRDNGGEGAPVSPAAPASHAPASHAAGVPAASQARQ